MKRKISFGITALVILTLLLAVLTACGGGGCHTHTPAKSVKENEVAATCTAEGSYEEVIYCSECDEEISRTTKTVDKLSHTEAEAVKENEVAATCTAEGSYDEVIYCSVCEEEISRTAKSIEKKAHSYVDGACSDCSACETHTPSAVVTENESSATCTTHGSYDEVVYCSVCEEEISRTQKTTDKLPHTSSEAVIENKIDATCKTEGSYDEVVYCSVCDAEMSRAEKTTAKTNEHVFSNGYCTVCGRKEASEGLAFEINSDNASYTMVGIGTCTDTNVIIPETHEGLPVTKIGDRAFFDCTTITGVEIPDSIIGIGGAAFVDCENLKCVKFGSGITEWGEDVFSGEFTESVEEVHIKDLAAWCKIDIDGSPCQASRGDRLHEHPPQAHHG